MVALIGLTSGLTVYPSTTIEQPNLNCTAVDTGGTDITAITVPANVSGGDNITFLHLSVVGCQTTSCANNLVVIGDNALVNMYDVNFNGGKFALQNGGTDGFVFGAYMCGTNTTTGGCVLQKGGDWYFHVKMDGTAKYGWYIDTHDGTSNEMACSVCDFSGTFTEAIHIDDEGDNAASVMISQSVPGAAINIVSAKRVMIIGSELDSNVAVASGSELSISGTVGSSTVTGTGVRNCSGNVGILCGVPVASTCTGLSLGTGSDDFSGNVGLTSGTTCSVSFAHTFTNAPFCTVAPGSAASTTEVTTSTTGFAVTFGSAQTAFAYQCMGY